MKAPRRHLPKTEPLSANASEREEALRLGEALRNLRERRGLRQNELATLAGLAATQICALENGRRQPSLQTLRRVCRALGVLPEDLMRAATGREAGTTARDPAPEAVLPGMQELFLSPEDRLFAPLARRGLVRTTRTDSFATPLPDERTVADLERRLSDYLRLEVLCGAFRRASIPLSLPFPATADGAEQLASRVRDVLGLGDTIVLDYVSLFESHGVRIVFLPLPPSVESLSFYDTVGASAFLVVREDATPEKQLFRMALELAWMYLFTRNGCKPVPEAAEANRRFAKFFAACFLLPRAAVLATSASLGIGRGDWSYPLVLRVKRHFGVSAEAFCYRLLELGLLDDAALTGFLATLRGFYATHQNREPGETLPPLMRNGRLSDLLERARGISGVWDEAAAIARHAGLSFGTTV